MDSRECGSLRQMVLCGFQSNTVEESTLSVDVLPPSAFTTNVQKKTAACQAHPSHPFLCLAYQVEHSVYCEAYLQSLSECQKEIYILNSTFLITSPG